MKIELNQDEVFIAINALSKTIARKKQDLRAFKADFFINSNGNKFVYYTFC